MCGIGGALNISIAPVRQLGRSLEVMNQLQQHRGPDGEEKWIHPNRHVGFCHRRLKIIDLELGIQPMQDKFGRTITYNGEIYNYKELKRELSGYPFKTDSDTEVILAAYDRWGEDCVTHLRGMFAFAIWDDKKQSLFCARDRLGIKPFYYTQVGETFYFASEAKALLPFIPEIATDLRALHDYIVFQFCLGDKTLFEGISTLLPGHWLKITSNGKQFKRYWEVYYDIDFNLRFEESRDVLEKLILDSVHLHTRSDVPIGSYVSGGVDSSLIASIASSYEREKGRSFCGFHGKFTHSDHYDESRFAQCQAKMNEIELKQVAIDQNDFLDSIEDVIYHLDYPVAGPGSFPQYHVSKLASQTHKVVLGGQGGDEIFGGYVRYLIAYFEQCIKAAIDGTHKNGNFIVSYESIIPNLTALKNYKPLLEHFWKDGLFENLDARYYRLINRAPNLENEIDWNIFDPDYHPYESFLRIFHGENVQKESYFDSMTHFDFKTLLPALLHVEDRMSMAHGVESRVPLLDHHIIEYAATLPSNVKFQNGTLKRILINSMNRYLCPEILNRQDKMGFPVPLNEWLKTSLSEYLNDIFLSDAFKSRPYFNHGAIANTIKKETTYGRGVWGLLSLELWHRKFHDQQHRYKSMISDSKAKIEITV